MPDWLSVPLFGDRKRFGDEIWADDPDWQEWQEFYLSFYQNTQKKGIGKLVNDSGYRILRDIDLEGKYVMEIGPGILPHMRFWQGKPKHYTVVDVKQELIDNSCLLLRSGGISTSSFLSASYKLPFEERCFDVVISFYSLEHVYPLHLYLEEIKRTLSPGGLLVGAIPAEGGLAWGMGRYLTSRRYIKRYSSINPDKIICWEHRNFTAAILEELDRMFHKDIVKFWPLVIPTIDLNLVVSFVYKK